MNDENDIRAVEMDLLIEGVRRVYGYDFSGYARASLRRRLEQWLARSDQPSFGAALSAVLRDPARCTALVEGITVNVSEMFRDPAVFRTLREQALPALRAFPHPRIWVAGCATGEELYSLAIVLHETGLLDTCRIYATDLSGQALAQARAGRYGLERMRQFTRNYQAAGGSGAFADYYVADADAARLDPALQRNVVFAEHNLATDADFSEIQLILCRNVLIYFQAPLKEHVLDLFDRCLSPGGLLCLGTKETLDGRRLAPAYREIVPRTRIYRKAPAHG